MGLGILEDRHLVNVPGTSLFNDDPNAAALKTYEGLDISGLKHGHGKYAHIVLVPQPTDDPNDPLNWPQWRKHVVSPYFYSQVNLIFTVLGLQVFFVLYVLRSQ